MFLRNRFLIILSSLLFVACTDSGFNGDVSVGSDSDWGIVGGAAVPEHGDAFSKSVALIYGEKESGEPFICTGAFISPTVVLTAAHCVVDDVNTMSVFRGATPLASGADYMDVKSVKKHENYHAQAKEDRNDIALIFLSAAAPKDTQIANLWDEKTALSAMYAYGYGRTDGFEDSANASADLGILRKVTLQGENLAVYEKGLYEYNQSNGRGVCFGDSGGPLFSGTGQVVGIAAGVEGADAGDDSCQFKSYFTQVVSYRDWITSNLIP